MKTLSYYINESLTQPTRIFTVVKPGFLDKTQEIIKLFEEQGWELERIRTTRLLYSQASQLYAVHKGEDFFKDLCEYMSSGPSTAIIYKRTDLPQDEVFKLVGDLKDIIRDRWGLDPCRNVLHSSDSFSAMEHELSIYF